MAAALLVVAEARRNRYIFLERYIAMVKPIHPKTAATVDDLLGRRGRHWAGSDTPASRFVVSLFRLSALLQERTGRLAASHGISFTEFEALAALRSQPAPHCLMPSDLYRAILISSGGLTKVLVSLGRKRLIHRVRGAEDGRSKPVALTDKGKALIERLMAQVLARDAKVFSAALTGAELRHTQRAMTRLLSSMEHTKE